MKFTVKDTDNESMIAYLHSSGRLFFNCTAIYNKEGALQGAIGIKNGPANPNGTADIKQIARNDNWNGTPLYEGNKLIVEF